MCFKKPYVSTKICQESSFSRLKKSCGGDIWYCDKAKMAICPVHCLWSEWIPGGSQLRWTAAWCVCLDACHEASGRASRRGGLEHAAYHGRSLPGPGPLHLHSETIGNGTGFRDPTFACRFATWRGRDRVNMSVLRLGDSNAVSSYCLWYKKNKLPFFGRGGLILVLQERCPERSTGGLRTLIFFLFFSNAFLPFFSSNVHAFLFLLPLPSSPKISLRRYRYRKQLSNMGEMFKTHLEYIYIELIGGINLHIKRLSFTENPFSFFLSLFI